VSGSEITEASLSMAPARAAPARIRPAVLSGHALLTLPLIVYLLAFYLYPVAAMLLRGVHPDGWSAAPFMEVAGDATFWRVMQITLEISVTVTLCCLLLGYPLAYWLARQTPARANLLLILVLIPFWTSILVRSYAWMALLERHGIVNNLLIALHAIPRPVKLLNTRFSVCLAMTHVLLPFMVLPLQACLRGLDWRLVRAAESLGSAPFATFRQVVLPLSRPGIAAGVTVVFTLAIGFYITPILVGASSDVVISMLIAGDVDQLLWPQASAMAAILLALVLLATMLLSRAIRGRLR
jgi:putative spermidine/putrescine transport system permease protein